MSKYLVLTTPGLARFEHGGGGRRAGVRAGGRRSPRDDAKLQVLKLNSREVAELDKDPENTVALAFRTKLIQPKRRRKKAKSAWGIDAIGATASSMDGDGVVVSVLDTGIDKSHASFDGIRGRITERAFGREASGDIDGHGTHCAGTIFGQDVDGIRIGVARNVGRALIGKVLDADGGDTGMLINGMLWAREQGANIISMSLGFDFPAEVERLKEELGVPTAIAASATLDAYGANLRAFDRLMDFIASAAPFTGNGGCVVVAATGNESQREKNAKWVVNASPPAAANGVVAVGAVRDGVRYKVAGFSNLRPKLVAPGVDILSADVETGGLVAWEGTSMATPHVAGAAALWWEKLGANATSEAVTHKLMATADEGRLLASEQGDLRGAGLVTCPA